MPFPFARALPILRGISELSGADLQRVDGVALVAWLAERGEEWSEVGINNAVRALTDARLIDCSFAPPGEATGSTVRRIKLDARGRQLVEGWPSTGSIDAQALASAIVTALAAQAEEPDAPEEIKSLGKRLGEGAVSAAINGAVAYGMKQAGIS